jgi:2-polyprenyl-3-methyl-5-hydroxy-6-metoxy-1,4-benzoquinol methylase
MITPASKVHWENVYNSKGEQEVSWFQESPQPSIELIGLVGTRPNAEIIDIGGGTSRLVDSLLTQGFENLTVLDLSEAALDKTRSRVGNDARSVRWIVADVTSWKPDAKYDVWHDRAALHFLIEREEQRAYVDRLKEALRPGGYAIIGTFALDGPEKCSGLSVARQSSETIGALLGPDFQLVDARRHQHTTPWQSVQNFQFSTFRRVMG